MAARKRKRRLGAVGKGGLGACGCPKGAKKIRAGKFGVRCYKGGKMVRTVSKRKKG